MMNIVKYSEADHYSEIEALWSKYDFSSVPALLLPKTGYVVLENNRVIAASFIYFTDCPMSFIEWIVGDKDASPRKRIEAVQMAMGACLALAKARGCLVTYNFTENTGLEKIMTRLLGFKNETRGLSSFVRRL